MAVAEWTYWYAREDPTTWVLAEILRRRAERRTKLTGAAIA